MTAPTTTAASSLTKASACWRKVNCVWIRSIGLGADQTLAEMPAATARRGAASDPPARHVGIRR